MSNRERAWTAEQVEAMIARLNGWNAANEAAAMLRAYAATLRQHPDDLALTTAESFANWLESLHECDADGAVGSRKWEAAQVAARAIRGMGQQGEQAGGVVSDEVARVAQHMALAIEYIEKQYPDARQLDRGPILRNLRRWKDRLQAVAPLLRAPAERGGRVDEARAGIDSPFNACMYRDHCRSMQAALAQDSQGDSFPVAVAMPDGTVRHPTGNQMMGVLTQNAQGEAVGLIIGQTRCYGDDEWYREITAGGIQFLAPLDQQDAAQHYLAARHAERARVPAPTILYTTEEVVEAQEILRKHGDALMDEVIDQMVDVLLAASPSQPEDAA